MSECHQASPAIGENTGENECVSELKYLEEYN